MVTSTVFPPRQATNSFLPVVDWRGGDPVEETLAEWVDPPFVGYSSESYEETCPVLILSAVQYPAWKRVWDNPEDSIYDQLLADL